MHTAHLAIVFGIRIALSEYNRLELTANKYTVQQTHYDDRITAANILAYRQSHKHSN